MIVKYGTKYCGDCRRLSAILDKLNVGYQEVNIDEEKAKELNIRAIPVLIKYKDEKEIDRMVGLSNISKIKEFVEG